MYDDNISKLKELMNEDLPASKILRDPCNFEIKEWLSNDIPISQFVIKSDQAAELLEKAPGTYVTIRTGPLYQEDRAVDDISACLTQPLRELLAPFFGRKLLICGIGNQELVPDSLGPETVRRLPLKVVETLHFKSKFTKMAAVAPGVEWGTNLNTATIIAGIAASMGAACVLLIDSLACTDYNRLCTSIQLASTGMSGHATLRRLDSKNIGVPVISIGVPMTVRADAIIREYTGDTLLTVNSVSTVVGTASYAIAAAILQAVCPGLDEQDVKALVEHNLVW